MDIFFEDLNSQDFQIRQNYDDFSRPLLCSDQFLFDFSSDKSQMRQETKIVTLEKQETCESVVQLSESTDFFNSLSSTPQNAESPDQFSPTSSALEEMRKNKEKPHLKNYRRKKSERNILISLIKLCSKFEKTKQNEEDFNLGELTKNLLAFAKKSLLAYLEPYATGLSWFQEIQEKFGMSLEDYDGIYKEQKFKIPLQEFFRKKILYRELLLSRTTPKNRIIYSYFMQIFERNFKKGKFVSISLTMVEIENQKLQNKRYA